MKGGEFVGHIRPDVVAKVGGADGVDGVDGADGVEEEEAVVMNVVELQSCWAVSVRID